MNTSPQIDKIAPALLAAQRDFRPVAKSATNPHFRSKYANLDSILAMALPVLNKHGLTLLQTQGDSGLSTVLVHESGQWIDGGTLKFQLDKATMQGLGSAVTYARRYTLGALLGIATEEDDDGNEASTPPQQVSRWQDWVVPNGSVAGHTLAEVAKMEGGRDVLTKMHDYMAKHNGDAQALAFVAQALESLQPKAA